MDDAEIMKMLVEVDQRAKSNTHQIEEIKGRQDKLDELVQSVATLATEQGYMKEDIGEIKDDVKTLTEKPAKHWDALIDKLLAAVAGAIIAWLAAGAPGA